LSPELKEQIGNEFAGVEHLYESCTEAEINELVDIAFMDHQTRTIRPTNN